MKGSTGVYLQALHLRNFRLYENATFEFSPKFNVIRGPNARGKTTILEAIFFLMTGRSFRTAQVNDLIRQGASYFCIDASFIKHGIEQTLRIHYNGKEKKITYNSTNYSSSLKLLGVLQGVVIHPDDVNVVKGAPGSRRQLLDLQLAQSDPLYVHHLTRYDRAMRQRNHLLRAKSVSTIESWEYEMSNAAAYIIQQRVKVVRDLELEGKELYHHICNGTENLSLVYKANGAGEHQVLSYEGLRQLFCDQYERHRRREMDLGATLTGPHKDDVLIALNDKEVRTFASEGQQRSCVIALRLAEWKWLSSASYEDPLMLVDDLGMSLDYKRRSSLLEYFSTLKQVFVTTTEESCLVDGEHVVIPKN